MQTILIFLIPILGFQEPNCRVKVLFWNKLLQFTIEEYHQLFLQTNLVIIYYIHLYWNYYTRFVAIVIRNIL